jgi:hypothetical protein
MSVAFFNALVSRAVVTAVRSVLHRNASRQAAAPVRGFPVEPLEPRTLLSAYWVTLQYPTTIDSNGGWMQIKNQYDQDQDGVSDYPVTAGTPLEAVREAIEGAYCGTVNHCGTQSSLSYSFPARASTEHDDAYQIDLSTFPTTGVGSGGIGLQKSWDDPYWDRNVYLPNWNDASWSVTADPRPKVWLQDGTDLSASENGRDPATFTIQREGGDSQSLDVYFQLSGSATPSTLSEGSYPDGIAEDGTDYTVTGASPDPNHPGYWKATLAAGQNSADVTIKPLNDAVDEDSESAVMTLVGDLAGQLNGAAGYMLADAAPVATQPGTQPATQPTTLQATVKGLKVAVTIPPDPLAGTPPTQEQTGATDASLRKCDSTSPQIRDAGVSELKDEFRANPALMPYAKDQAANGQYGAGVGVLVNGAADDITAELRPFVLSTGTDAGKTGLVVTLAPVGTEHANSDKIRVFITFDDPSVVDRELTHAGLNEYFDVPVNTTSLPVALLIPKKVGTTTLRVKQQFRAVDPQTGEETIVGPPRDYSWDVTVTEST